MGVETWVAIGNFIKAIFVGAAAGSSSAYIFAVNVARVAALSFAAKLTSPKPDLTASAVNKILTLRETTAPQRFVYGEDMVSGPLLFTNTGGDDNKDLYFVVPICGHEFDSVIRYRIDDETIELSDLSGADSGTVDAGKFAGVAEIDVKKGTMTQSVFAALSAEYPALFTAAHTGRGWGLIMVKFTLVEGSESAFDTGIPRNMRATIRGRKLYDPRLDTTNGGTGPHRLADPTTWEWESGGKEIGRNPALCCADWMRDDKFGVRELDARINWPRIAAAADVCDELPAIPPADTQARYTCNFTGEATAPRGEILDKLMGAMLGRRVFSQGLWNFWAGEALTSDVNLTEANLRGGIQLQASHGAKERWNRVRGKFVDPDRDYTANPYIEQRSSAFVTLDGGEVNEKVADFPATQNGFEAQRNAIITLKQSRNQRTLVFEGNYSCFRIQPGSVCTLDCAEYGFSGDKFFVTEWVFSGDGINLTMVEEDDSVWADPAIGDYSTRTPSGVIVFGETGVIAPTGLMATSVSDGVQLNWMNPPESTFAFIEIWSSHDNDRSNATLIATTPAATYRDVLNDAGLRNYYWIRAVRHESVSAWQPASASAGVVGSPLANSANLLSDPDFALSIAIGTFVNAAPTADQHDFHWVQEVDDNADPITATSITFLPAGGVNGTGAIKCVRGDPATSPFRSEGQFKNGHRFRGNDFRHRVILKWRNQGTEAFDNVQLGIRGFDAQELGTQNAFSLISNLSFATTGATWQIAEFIFDSGTNDVLAEFWEFSLTWSFVSEPVAELEIDSVFIYKLDPEFAGAGTSGIVKDPVSEAGKYYRDDGTWDNPPGGSAPVTSVFTRTGAVIALVADYLGLYVDSFKGRKGAVVPAAGDYSGIIETFTVLQTFEAGLRLNDDDTIVLGDGADLSMRWDSTPGELSFVGLVSSQKVNWLDGMEIRIWNSGDSDYVSIFHDGVDAWISGLNNRWLRIGADFEQLIIEGGIIGMIERAASQPDNATVGQFWVRNDVPNTPMFTDDAGNDFDLSASAAHTHTLVDVTDSGALAALDQVGTSELVADSVTAGKLANMVQARFKGRNLTAGTGNPQDLTAAQARTILDIESQTLTWVGVQTFAAGIKLDDDDAILFGTGADVLMRWDSTPGELSFVGLASNQKVNWLDGMEVRFWNSGDTDYVSIRHDGVDAWLGGLNSRWLRFDADFDQVMIESGCLGMVERASAPADDATVGKWWTRTATPNEPMFTNDTGRDQLLDPSVSTVVTANGNRTLVIGDAGKTIQKTSGGSGETYTIPANASVAFKIGTMIGVANDGGGTLTIAITTDTLEGTDGATGSRTLGNNHEAVIRKMTSTKWRYVASDL